MWSVLTPLMDPPTSIALCPLEPFLASTERYNVMDKPLFWDPEES